LQAVTIGNNVKWIGNNAFAYCISLQKIAIPSGVTAIGSCAFYGCGTLWYVVIQTPYLTYQRIGANAFKGTYNGAWIRVPASRVTLYSRIFPYKGLGTRSKVTK
jgi:hypothetical protein